MNERKTTVTPERWHRVKEVFEAALERAPSERSAFLAQACAGDDSMHSEVKSLLSSYEQEQRFMDTPAAALAAQSLMKEESAALVGQQLGHYQINRELGRGGMGVVYLAQDNSLGRSVALKVLPIHLTGDPERLRRFEREARAASALNHPNILTIHEIGQMDGLHFIATEFIDGVTLRDKIEEKELELSHTFNIAEQMASALAAAHEAGIVHRDIKPENVMLRRDGYVKVLDFGLAKLTEQQSFDAAAGSTTVVGLNTDTGIAGTAGYMSPEQARGESVDHRTDIFSLGVVLYEMLTGRMPFEMKAPDGIRVPMFEHEPPPLTDYSPKAPAKLQLLVSKALRQNREERYQAATELLADLKSVRSERTGKRGLTTGRLSLLAAALALMIGGPIWFYASRHNAKSTLPPMKVVPFTSFAGAELDPAFSPDGKEIAFNWTGEKDDNFDIYVKQIDSPAPRRLTTHPAVDLSPVWSPDGAYIAFSRLSVTDGGIYVVPAKGGAERKVYSAKWDDPVLARIDWSPDGKLLTFQDRSSLQEPYSIFVLSIETLEKRKLTSPPEGHWNGDWNPAFSPDGNTLAFMRDSSVNTEDIYLVPVGGGEPRRLTFDNTLLRGVAWTPDSSAIVFTSQRGGNNLRLWRVSVLGGTPEPLVAGGEKAFSIAISRQGNRLAYTQASPGNTDIWRIELSSSTGRGSLPVKLIGSSLADENPKYSPDGKKIAFASDRSGSIEIWVCDSDGSNQVKLTNFGGPLGGTPDWSPDGRQIAFDSRPEGYSQIFVINADGGQPLRITKDNVEDAQPSWSKDGNWIYFSSVRGREALQTWKIPIHGGEAVQVTKRGGFRHSESPDGKFFYYDVEDAGVWSIRRIPIEGGQESKIIEIAPLTYNWTVTAQGIYFVNVETKPFPTIEFLSFATGKVKQVVSVEKDLGNGIDVSPDGRWLLYSQIEGRWSSDIMLVENFR